jgi:hypothetical protein
VTGEISTSEVVGCRLERVTQGLANVRSGSLAEIRPKELDVRFTPKSGHGLAQS